MNKFITMMLTLAVTLFAANSFAWDPPVSPAPTSWISDNSGVLSADAHTRLDAKLKQINQSSANELAALIVSTLDGQSIEDVTNATFKSWGVGKKNLDNGVLVVIAMKEHKMRIETGKGVEGDLPDLKTQDIQINLMRPLMKKGDVEGALSTGFSAIANSIANHRADVAAGHTSTPTTTSVSNGNGCQVSEVGTGYNINWWVLVGAAIGLFAVLFITRRSRKRREHERDIARLAEETARLARENAQRRRVAVEARLKRESEETISKHTATVPAPVLVRPVAPVFPVVGEIFTVTQSRPVSAKPSSNGPSDKIEREREAERARNRRAAEERSRQEDEDRRRRERDEEDARRRRRDEESSSSSSPSFDWGGGSSDDSGGFGGGDSGGGGSSSDW